MRARPKLFVSRCLGFERCRYNGQTIEYDFVAVLAKHCDVVTACPEADTGLGVPRDPVRLATVDGRVRMLQPASGRDHTEAMESWCASAATRFSSGPDIIDGAVLKSRSPSCGWKDVRRYYSGEPGAMYETGAGMFGGVLVAALCGAPVEDEGRLRNFTIREHFLSSLFALASFRETAATGKLGTLVDYHSRNKLMFLAMNQASMRRLGKITANAGNLPVPEIFARYRAELGSMFSTPAKPGSIVNTALHAFGGFSERLSPAERKLFVDTVEEYRDERLPASALYALLKSWAVRFEVAYLLGQTFLDPYPRELVEISDSGKGRDR